MNRSHCTGCRDDFYNGHNNLGVTECWMLKDAKIITRYAIDTWAPTVKESFRKVKKPNCYHSQGTVYYNALPEHCR